MSCAQPTIRVFDGLDNPANVVYGYTDDQGVNQLYDFSTTSRFVPTLTKAGATPVVPDTDIKANLITDEGNGELEFVLGQEGIPIGLYIGTLVITNPAYPGGYLMDTGEGSTLMVDVR
jgi:hypothetical protein